MIFSSWMSSLRSSPSACRTSRRAALKHWTLIVALRRRCIGDRVGARLSKPSSKRDYSSSGKAPVSLVTCKETGVWKGLSKTTLFQRGSCQKEDAPYTLNEREHLRLVTRLRIWGRSSESFAREWDRGGRARRVTRAFDTWPGACRLLA